MAKSVYAEQGGVDYELLQKFKDMMVAVGRRTRRFCEDGDFPIRIIPLAHGVYLDLGRWNRGIVLTLEGLGNKSWLAERMRQLDPAGGSRYDQIAQDVIMMALNDNIAHGSVPKVLLDEVSAKTSEWFADPVRAADFARGVYQTCKRERITLGAGESPAYKFLLGAMPPVEDAPVMSAVIAGMVTPKTLIRCTDIRPGDLMIAAPSGGWHSNGISAGINIGLSLPDQFMTELPSGRKLGDAMLDPTPSYAPFVRTLINSGISIHAFLPMTGDGVGKLAFDKKELTYVVDNWWPEEEIPEIFHFLRCQSVFEGKDTDFLTTYQYGCGYTAFVAKSNADKAMEVASAAGYKPLIIGRVEKGKRGTVFGPWNNLWLNPPGE